jgi:predicted Zn-dependent peptidase
MTFAIAVNSPQHTLTAPVIHRLDNGLTIIAEQMPVAAVNLSLWLRVGSVMESDSINGMAHFLEHMIFKGTSQLPLGEFERRIEARGGITNAATSQDYTHFFITTAPPDFTALAPLQIELVMNPLLTDTEFERERPVILEEILRAQDNSRRRTFYHTMALAFERLPYRRPVLGTASVVETLTPDQMREFHSHWYQPERITVVAVGNLPVETLIETVAKGFEEALAKRSPSNPGRFGATNVYRSAPEPPFAAIQRQDLYDPTLTQARLVMNWRVPGLAEVEKTPVLDVLASVLGRGRMARLVQDLREQRQWVTSISASNVSYWQQGVFSISAHLPEKHLAEVEAEIVAHVTRLNETPIQESELRRIQTQVVNRYVFASESPSDRAGLYGYYQTLTGSLDYALNYPAYVQLLTVADVQRAAQQYLSPIAYRVLMLRPGEQPEA